MRLCRHASSNNSSSDDVVAAVRAASSDHTRRVSGLMHAALSNDIHLQATRGDRVRGWPVRGRR